MVFTFFLIPIIAFAHVIQDDVKTVQKSRFSFKTVCERMVSHESPLIEEISGRELDCMGKKVEIGKFCEKELAQDPYYIRAYIVKDSKEVVCHSGKTVIFKYLCAKSTDSKYCDHSAKTSCRIIHDLLAKRLDTVHESFTVNNRGQKQLNCYFESLPVAGTFNSVL